MTQIAGAERLTAIFGHWPTFHDAEIVRVMLDRADVEGRDYRGPTVTIAVRVFRMGTEVAPDGTYVLHDQTLATLRFGGVTHLELYDLNQQNVLAQLEIDDIRDRQLEDIAYQIHLTSSFGLSGQFLCATAEVVAAVPWPLGAEPLAAGADV